MASQSSAQEQAVAALRQATEQATDALLGSSLTQKALEQRVAALEEDLSEARDEIKMVGQDLKLREKELDLEISSNKRLQAELKEYETRAEDFHNFEEVLKQKDKYIAELEQQLEQNKGKEYAKLEKQLQTSEQQLEKSNTTIEKLKGRIWGLKDERDLKEPLVQVGVAIRCQFLIHAKDKSFGRSLDQASDTEHIKRGNAAAYEGNGLADEALLLAGFLDMKEWKEFFANNLYGVQPGEYASCFQGYQRARNCWVTVQTVQPGRGAKPCFLARSEVDRRTLEIFKEYARDGDAADVNPGVQKSIARVEKLTEEIADSVRGGPVGLIFPAPKGPKGS
ncbi:hypothetical protein V8E51_004940 [Hyaloscypha variabilis]